MNTLDRNDLAVLCRQPVHQMLHATSSSCGCMQCMVCHSSRVNEEHDEDYEKHEEVAACSAWFVMIHVYMKSMTKIMRSTKSIGKRIMRHVIQSPSLSAELLRARTGLSLISLGRSSTGWNTCCGRCRLLVASVVPTCCCSQRP